MTAHEIANLLTCRIPQNWGLLIFETPPFYKYLENWKVSNIERFKNYSSELGSTLDFPLAIFSPF